MPTPLKDKVQNTLDECRMMILGGQVLISFAAEAVLEPGFLELPTTARWACLVGMSLLVLTVGLFMWPAAYHRVVCAGEDRARLHRFATQVLCVGLLPFAISLGASMYVVGERTGGPALAGLLAVLMVAACLCAWYAVPMLVRTQRKNGQASMKIPEEPTELADKVRHVLTEARMVLPGAQALLGSGRYPC